VEVRGRTATPIAVIDDDGNDEREMRRARLLRETLLPNIEHISQELKDREAMRPALVLEEDIEERLFPAIARREEQIGGGILERAIEERIGLSLQGVEIEIGGQGRR
jgi:hypothetical protein